MPGIVISRYGTTFKHRVLPGVVDELKGCRKNDG